LYIVVSIDFDPVNFCFICFMFRRLVKVGIRCVI
jgi:hypothetical protein